MATKTRKPRSSAEDDRMARGRFVDQPGQWVNKTSKSVMKRRSKGLESLAKQMESRKKGGKK